MHCFTKTNHQQLSTRCSQYKSWKTLRFTLLLLSLFVPFLASCSPTNSVGSAGSQRVAVQQNPKARLTYVAIGASDTFGVGADDPTTENWPTDLASLLGSDVRLVNLGVPGITLHQALNVELPIALDARPNLITIWLAVNDLANNVPLDSYSHDLDLLLSRIQVADPTAQIAIANVPDLMYLPYFSNFAEPQMLYAQVQAYNAAIATAVKQYHVILVDVYQQWSELRSHPEYISDDGLHPSTLGYTQIAALFFSALQSKS